jgi:hypothetical protein
MCRQIGISPLQLVRGVIDESDSAAAITKAAADIRLERPSIQHTRIDSAAIRQALKPFWPATNCRHRRSVSLRIVLDRRPPTSVTTSPTSAALLRPAIAVIWRRKALAFGHDCARGCATRQSP